MTAVVAILKVFGDKSNSRNFTPRKLLIKPNKWLNLKKNDLKQSNKHLNGLSKPVSNLSKRLIVKQKTIRVLINTGLSGDLLFIKKGSQKYTNCEEGCATIVGHFQRHLSNKKGGYD